MVLKQRQQLPVFGKIFSEIVHQEIIDSKAADNYCFMLAYEWLVAFSLSVYDSKFPSKVLVSCLYR